MSYEDPPRSDFLDVNFGLALLLLPLGVGFLFMVGSLRVLFGAIPWMLLWSIGFLGGGLVGRLLDGLGASELSGEQAWAVGGGIGMILMSSLHGIATAWLSWSSRHDMNPYQGIVDLPPESEEIRRHFAAGMQFPALLATTLAGLIPALCLFSSLWVPEWASPSAGGFALAGAAGLAAEGGLMGAFLGAQRARTMYGSLHSSWGEVAGRNLAGPNPGCRCACGWAIGYAIHQALPGAAAGLVLGFVVHMII